MDLFIGGCCLADQFFGAGQHLLPLRIWTCSEVLGLLRVRSSGPSSCCGKREEVIDQVKLLPGLFDFTHAFRLPDETEPIVL